MFGLRGPFENNFGDLTVRDIIIEKLNKYFPNIKIEVTTREDFKSNPMIIFDASGFAYSDDWGKWSIDPAITAIKNFDSAKNARRIFLPQSWGPFKNSELISHIQQITKNALVFSRDKTSVKYLKDINIDSILAPDLMFLLEEEKGKNPKDEVSICPNIRVQERNEGFLEWFITIYQQLPFSFKKVNNIYSSTDDKNISESIGKSHNFNYKSIQNTLRKSNLVISARLHPLLYSLIHGSMVVPITWSHKYYEIIDEYNLKELKINDTMSEVFKIISYLKPKIEENKEITRKLAARARSDIFPQVFDWINK